MTIPKNFWLVFLFAIFAIGQHLGAQVELSTPEAEPEEEAEAAPAPESPAEITAGTTPEGSVIAGSLGPSAVFDVARRIHVSASVLGGYDDNVANREPASSSWFFNVNGLFSYKFGTSRLAMHLIAGAGITHYFDRPETVSSSVLPPRSLRRPNDSGYEPNLNLRLSLAYKLTPRLTFDLSALAAYQSEPDYSTSLSANRRLGNFFRSADTLSLDYQWTPRLSIASNYTLEVVKYEGSAGAFSNRIAQSFGESVRFLWLPTTNATGEYRFTTTSYENSLRDATGHLFTVGLDHTFDPRWGALVRGGVQFRMTEGLGNGAGGGDRTSPYGEATVHYKFEPRASVAWTNRYSIEESDVPGRESQTAFRTNLQLLYGITPRISATMGISYQLRQGGAGGRGNSSDRNVLDISPSLRYHITRYAAFTIGYSHSEVDQASNGTRAGNTLAPFGSYSRNRYFAGVNLRF